MSLESRARLAQHELEITQEAHAKYRDKLITDAIEHADKGREREAFISLLQIVALDNLRMMVGVPVRELEYEAEAAQRRQASGQAN